MTVTEPDSRVRDALDGNAVVSTPGEAGYDDAVRIWNAAITRRPSVVVGCTSDSDVCRRARICATRGTRGLGPRRRPQLRRARADRGRADDRPHADEDSDGRPGGAAGECGGGTTWADLDAATQAHGLAVTGGFISHTGVAA